MTGTEREDVIVIGASTAGLFAAYRLAQAGVPVRVLEAQPEWQPEPVPSVAEGTNADKKTKRDLRKSAKATVGGPSAFILQICVPLLPQPSLAQAQTSGGANVPTPVLSAVEGSQPSLAPQGRPPDPSMACFLFDTTFLAKAIGQLLQLPSISSMLQCGWIERVEEAETYERVRRRSP